MKTAKKKRKVEYKQAGQRIFIKKVGRIGKLYRSVLK